MADAITAAGAWVLGNSIGGGVLIVLLAAVAVIGGRLGPRWQMLLWSLVGLRLILPMSPSSDLSVFNLIPDREREATAMPAGAELLSMEYDVAPVSDAAVVVEAQPAALVIDWSLVLGLIWSVGAASILGVAVIRQWRSWRRVRLLPEPDDPELLRIYRECLQVADLMGSRVRLAESPRAGEIAVFGVLRAHRILVPADMMARYSEEEIRGVILHELAHVRRRDLLRNWLSLIVGALHWFNPLVWWAGSRLRAERELICDAIALHGLGEGGRNEYGCALIRTVEAVGRPPAGCPALVPFFSQKSELKRRLTMITNTSQAAHPIRRIAAASAAAVALAATFTSAVADEERRTREERKTHEERSLFDGGDDFAQTRPSDEGDDATRRGLFGGDDDNIEPSLFDEGSDTVERGLFGGGDDAIEGSDFAELGGLAGGDEALSAFDAERVREGKLKIYINKRGPYIHGKHTPLELLPPMVRKFGRQGVVLSAERDVPYERVVQAVEMIQKGGATNISFAVPEPLNERERNARRRKEVGKERAAAEAAERAAHKAEARREIEVLTERRQKVRAMEEEERHRAELMERVEQARRNAELELRRAQEALEQTRQQLAELDRRRAETAKQAEQATKQLHEAQRQIERQRNQKGR